MHLLFLFCFYQKLLFVCNMRKKLLFFLSMKTLQIVEKEMSKYLIVTFLIKFQTLWCLFYRLSKVNNFFLFIYFKNNQNWLRLICRSRWQGAPEAPLQTSLFSSLIFKTRLFLFLSKSEQIVFIFICHRKAFYFVFKSKKRLKEKSKRFHYSSSCSCETTLFSN